MTKNMSVTGSYNGMDEFRNAGDRLSKAHQTLVPGWMLAQTVDYLRIYHRQSPYRLIKTKPGAGQTDCDWEFWASQPTRNCVFAFVQGMRMSNQNINHGNLYPNAAGR
jgi:hypothetical protein